MSIFRLPDLGEGLPDAEIREWHVKVGDEIQADEPLVSMETAKAVVEVPSPQTGKIVKLYGKAGDTIDTGAALVEFLGAGEAKNVTTPASTTTDTTGTHNKSSTVAGKIEEGTEILDEANYATTNSIHTAKPAVATIKATPAVRALAKKLGVDLSCIKATGANGIVTADDVKAASLSQAEIGDAEPLKGVRKAMAATMTQSHSEVAPATLFDDADLYNWDKNQDITVRLIRALVAACKAEPSLNAWYDSTNNTRRVAKNIHLGLAVDTPEGLFVPVLKNIEQTDLSALRDQIETIKSQIKDRTIAQEQLRGNTITLSNIGTVAGKYACPVVVPPTVAIIAIGKIFNTVHLNSDNQLENHRTIPVSLTFDHRTVTGGEAARFLAAFISDLQKNS